MLTFRLTITGPTGSNGKTPFTLEWDDDGRKRGQCFNADLAAHVAGIRADGHEVVDVTPRDPATRLPPMPGAPCTCLNCLHRRSVGKTPLHGET